MICRVVSLGVFALTLFSFVPFCSEAQEVGAEKEIQQMVGENYLYSIDFLFLKGWQKGNCVFLRPINLIFIEQN